MDELRAGRELDALCARELGHADVRHHVYSDGGMQWLWGVVGIDSEILPCYSTNGEDIRRLEDEIELRRLQERYMYELERIVLSRDHWEYIRATPEQRARAFLEATKGAAE